MSTKLFLAVCLALLPVQVARAVGSQADPTPSTPINAPPAAPTDVTPSAPGKDINNTYWADKQETGEQKENKTVNQAIAEVKKPLSPRALDTKQYILANYHPLMDDLAKGEGPTLKGLLDKLKISPAGRPDAILQLQSMSKTYTDIGDFANHVLSTYRDKLKKK